MNVYIFNGNDFRLYDNYALKGFVAAGGNAKHMYYVVDHWHYPKSIHAQKFIYGVIKQNGIPCNIVDKFDDVGLTEGATIHMNRTVYPPEIDDDKTNWHPYGAAIRTKKCKLILYNDWSMLSESPRQVPYMVFTPFYKRAVNILKQPSSERLIEPIEKVIPQADDLDCRRGAAFMCASPRDYDHDVGSGISPYLSRGVISVREAIKAGIESEDFIRELLWREFYYQIAINKPKAMKMGNAYGVIAGKKHDNLSKWKAGKTGIDYVDLAMKELREFGTMPNRLRMLVAELLCGPKYYDIGWWYGEEHFEKYLEDYDFVLNRGNWLWCADPDRPWSKPSFRAFNLDRQAKNRAVKIFMAAKPD